MTPRQWLRRFRYGLWTLMGGHGGWFIPYRYGASIGVEAERRPYDVLETVFEENQGAFADLIAEIDALAPFLDAIGEAAPPAPRFTQDWFPRLDAAAAYAIVATRRPSRIIEIGSGHSTRFMARAIHDHGLTVSLTAIDPAPRAALKGLPVTWIEAPLQQADTAVFDGLAPGDILFMDSSHILMPGSDVDVVLNRIIPALPKGVLVHVHDVCLPDPYPAGWRWRGYNEQQAIAPMLTLGRVRPLFASHYVATRMADTVAKSVLGRLPLSPGTPETSLWLEIAA